MTNVDQEDANGEESHSSLSQHTPPTCTASKRLHDGKRTLSEVSYGESMKTDLALCAGCHRPILDKYYMWVDRRCWHDECVKCSLCQRPLSETCFTKDCKLYCPQDYKQLRQCRRCRGEIPYDNLVHRVGEHSFHLNCFSCDLCHRKLQSGEQFLPDDNCKRIYCKSCLDRDEAAQLARNYTVDDSGSDSEKSDDDVFPHHITQGHLPPFATSGGIPHLAMIRNKLGGKSSPPMSMLISPSDRKRAKRPRTILTTAQRRKFKASFETSQKPCRKVRETLAADTGLSPRVVQVWFQNQRAKMKKLARRQTTQGSSNGQNLRAGQRSRRKRTVDSDSDNDLSSPNSYISTSHQHSLYRSPLSETSPSISISDGSANLYQRFPPPNYAGDSLCDNDEFEPGFLSHDTSSGQLMNYQSHTVPGSEPSSASSADQLRLHLDLQSRDCSNLESLHGMVGESITVTSPQAMNSFFTQESAERNPIHKLMYMQNNFFSNSIRE